MYMYYMYMYVEPLHVHCTCTCICSKCLPKKRSKYLPPLEIAESGLGTFPDYTTAQEGSGGIVH